MKILGTAAVILAGLAFVAGDVLAQQTPTRRTVPKPNSQSQAIQQQQRGQYPEFERGGLLPKGAINYNWATKCAPDESTRSYLYKPGVEIRVRARQLIGTVLQFPEEVAAITSGLGNAISLTPYPNKEAGSSRLWVLGARSAGLDGNLAFIGGQEVGGPRIYSLRVQTEGVNTDNCPDILVNIRSTTDSSIDEVAGRVARALAGSGAVPPAPLAVPLQPVERAGLTPARPGPGTVGADVASTEGTGRQDVDWLEGFKFDPSKLDFKWRMGGDENAQSFAPDAVYSDDEFMYLHWRPERMKQIILPAISAVITTERGKVDAPVPWVRRGNTVIVQRITALSLEFEGLVVCVTRDAERAEK